MSYNQSNMSEKIETTQYRKTDRRSSSSNQQRSSSGAYGKGGGGPAPSPSYNSSNSRSSHGEKTSNMSEKIETTQYRKTNRRSSSSNQQRSSSGAYGKGGGGPAPSPSYNSSNSRSYKKNRNNAQGGQSRAHVPTASVNSSANSATTLDSSATTNAAAASTPRTTTAVVQNGSHAHPQLHGAADAPVTSAAAKPAEPPAPAAAVQRSTRPVPKAPTSQSSAMSSDPAAAPKTPVKAPGDASKPYPFQFGSISPGFMNGMQVPARTSSAPPNFDEQKRDQARHDSFRPPPPLPIPTAAKQQFPRKDAVAAEQSNTGEAHSGPKVKKDVQVSPVPPASQPQKPPVLPPTGGMSMPMQYHQPPVSVQFAGPNQQLQSQGMTAAPHQMQLSMGLSMANAPQVQPPVFLQPHPMQQGIIHQSQYTAQMGPQLPPQLGNMGMGMTPPYPQQKGGKFGGPRKTIVKIIHPDTHEELRLDKQADSYSDGGSSAPRSLPNMPPQSQPIPSFAPSHPLNFYNPNSFNAGSMFYLPQSSVPLTSSQLALNSQAPRFNYPVGQNPQNMAYMNPSALNSLPVNKTGTPMHVTADLPRHEGEDVEIIGGGLAPLPASGAKDKPILDQNKAKVTSKATKKKRKEIPSKKKKKRKEICLKADAAGITSDLYNAYKGPEEKKETILSTDYTESISTCVNEKQAPTNAKKYSQDFLLKFSEQCTNLPEDFEITSDIEALMSANLNLSHLAERDSYPSPGRIVDRPSGGSRLDHHGSSNSIGEEDRWGRLLGHFAICDVRLDPVPVCGGNTGFRPGPGGNYGVLRNPRGQAPMQYPEGILSGPSMGSQGGMPRNSPDTVDASSSKSDSIGSNEIGTMSGTSDQQSAPIPAPDLKEATSKHEGEDAEIIGGGLAPLPASGAKDKPILDQNKEKIISKATKKKKKKFLLKVDATETTSDLHNAYKVPEEKKETILSTDYTESISTCVNVKQATADAVEVDAVASEKGGLNKAEPDDWEDAADLSTPKLEVSDDGQLIHGGLDHYDHDGDGSMAKKYSRDFLLKFSKQCTDLPEDFEITSFIEALMSANLNLSHLAKRDSYPSQGRIVDRPSGGS